MAKGLKVEYGVFIAPVGLGEGVLSVKEYFTQMEARYPQAQGWTVAERHIYPNTDTRYLMAYHLEKEVG